MSLVLQAHRRLLRNNQQVNLAWGFRLRTVRVTSTWIPQTTDPRYRHSGGSEYRIRERLGHLPFLGRYSSLVNHSDRHSPKFVIAGMRGCEQHDYLGERYCML